MLQITDEEYGSKDRLVGLREHDFGCRHDAFKISDRLPQGNN